MGEKFTVRVGIGILCLYLISNVQATTWWGHKTESRQGIRVTFGEEKIIERLRQLRLGYAEYKNSSRPNRREAPNTRRGANPINVPKRLVSTGSGIDADIRASYAYKISEDKDFVLLLNAENRLWREGEKHAIPYKLCWTWDAWNKGVLPNQAWCAKQRGVFWRTHYDYGFCGVSDGYYKNIVDDIRFKTDWRWQIEQCYQLYKRGTRFYAWKHRVSRGKNIIFF